MMVAFREAIALVHAHARPLGNEVLPLADAVGRVTADSPAGSEDYGLTKAFRRSRQ